MSEALRVAIVDDMPSDAQLVLDYLDRFQAEQGCLIESHVYHASIDFLEEYRGQYDVLFLDIEMPGTNGMELAREIRGKDEGVGIIFVTSMLQYAINGYEVNAIDFMVKPITYYDFSAKLEKGMRFFRKRRVEVLLIESKNGIYRLPVSEILYIEKDRDNAIYHTKTETIQERRSMKSIREKLENLSFAESTAGCLVNLRYVKRIGKDSALLTSGDMVMISRRQKAGFLQAYIEYAEGGF